MQLRDLILRAEFPVSRFIIRASVSAVSPIKECDCCRRHAKICLLTAIGGSLKFQFFNAYEYSLQIK